MKVKIGNLEVTVDSLDELDELVKRYGGETSAANGAVQKPVTHHKPLVGTAAADGVVLKKFIEADDSVTS